MRQWYKWYAEPLDGKSHNAFVAMRTGVHTNLGGDIAGELFKTFTHVCTCKV